MAGATYRFCDAKLACFTWHGAVLETSEEEGVSGSDFVVAGLFFVCV